MSFEDFLFLALAAILFNGVEPFVAILEFQTHNFSASGSRSHPIATEQVSAQSNQRSKIDFQVATVAAILNFPLAHLAICCLLGT